MRIIRGKYKGRHFTPPKGFKARPTTDYAKEGLFNILENTYFVEGATVLDLFSGTGSISFEFVSRGAEKVVAVEKNSGHYAFIKKVKDDLSMDNFHTVRGDALKFIERPIGSFDIVFADPPYDLEGVEKIPEKIMEGNILSPEGIFILEHSSNVKMIYSQYLVDSRTYGKVNFSIYRLKK